MQIRQLCFRGLFSIIIISTPLSYTFASQGRVVRGDGQNTGPENRSEIKEGRDEILSESSLSREDAQQIWLKRCHAWIRGIEVKLKDHNILLVGCGGVQCEDAGPTKKCRSSALYKYQAKLIEGSSPQISSAAGKE